MRIRGRVLFTCGALVAVLAASCSSSNGKSANPPNTVPASGTSATTTSIGSSTTAPSRSLSLHVAMAPWQLPAPRAREVVLAGTHALYVIGGLDAGKSSTGRVWNTALPAGVTTRLGVLPQVAHDAAGAVLGSRVFVFGGGEAQTIAAVQEYSAGSTRVAGRLPQPRSDLVAAVIGTTAYVLGGFDGTTGTPDVLATNDGASFHTVAQLRQTVRYAAAAAVGGRVYVFGGEHEGNNVTTVQAVDPVSGTTTIVAQLPVPLAHESAVVLNGLVYLSGGRSHGQIVDTVYAFDPATNTTQLVAHLPYPVADAGAATVDGVGYVVGGESPTVPVRASAVTIQFS